MSEQQPDTTGPTVDEERGEFGSAGWDALDDEDNTTDQDIPRPDPDKDQG